MNAEQAEMEAEIARLKALREKEKEEWIIKANQGKTEMMEKQRKELEERYRQLLEQNRLEMQAEILAIKAQFEADKVDFEVDTDDVKDANFSLLKYVNLIDGGM